MHRHASFKIGISGWGQPYSRRESVEMQAASHAPSKQAVRSSLLKCLSSSLDRFERRHSPWLELLLLEKFREGRGISTRCANGLVACLLGWLTKLVGAQRTLIRSANKRYPFLNGTFFFFFYGRWKEVPLSRKFILKRSNINS